jgi:hypothetical protein
MIHEIVSSDVDLAMEMMASGQTDTEILASLASRGLDPAQAAGLMDDLHQGRKPKVKLPFELRPASQRAVNGQGTARENEPSERHPHRSHSGSGMHKRSTTPWWFIILLGITLVALGYILMEGGTQASREGINEEKHAIPPAPGK